MRIPSHDAPLLLAPGPALPQPPLAPVLRAPRAARPDADRRVEAAPGAKSALLLPEGAPAPDKADPTDVRFEAEGDTVSASGGFVGFLLDLVGTGLDFLAKLRRLLPF